MEACIGIEDEAFQATDRGRIGRVSTAWRFGWYTWLQIYGMW